MWFRALLISLLCALVLVLGLGELGQYLQRNKEARDELLSLSAGALSSLLPAKAAPNTPNTNSCSNVDAFSSYDQSGLQESDYGISAVGTFRVAGEENEHKQPMFNLAKIDCTPDPTVGGNLECKVTEAVVWAEAGNPNKDRPNCSLDADVSTYPMKQLGNGVLTGMEAGTSACYNSMLTIDRNTKRVYLSFTKTGEADKYDKIIAGTCGKLPPTQVLMNCTAWPRMRKGAKAPPRYCDFSSSADK